MEKELLTGETTGADEEWKSRCHGFDAGHH